MAIAGAIGTGSVIEGIIFMMIFGLGTIPMMLAISLVGNAISLPLRNKINKIIPYVVVVIGIIFILRGLSLGIPYLSPPVEKLTPGMTYARGNEIGSHMASGRHVFIVEQTVVNTR